jgi:hypothetical protein
VSQKSTIAIRGLSRVYRENSAEYRRTFSENDMAHLVSSAIGSVISGSLSSEATDFPIPADPQTFWTALRAQLASDIGQLNQNRIHLFGAWVIQGASIPQIAVGPCRFSIREHWIEGAAAEGLLTRSQASSLRDYWNHGATIDRGPEQGPNGRIIREIADAVGPCPWVCEIKVLGHTDGRSRQKALLAVRIALSAISLAWQTPSQQAARNGTGLIYELGPAHIRDTVTFQNGSFAVASHQSVLRLGRFLTMGDSAAFAASTGRRLETVGVALDTFLSTNPSGPKVLLEEALCRSLIWFGEACNEPLDFMAIVKFGAALDALANSKRAHGICELVQRRCAVSDDIDAPFLTDGTSAKRLVDEIYNTGRSQIVHGTRSSLVDDLEELRARAEVLASLVLRASIHWLDTYAGIDDVNAFATQA